MRTEEKRNAIKKQLGELGFKSGTRVHIENISSDMVSIYANEMYIGLYSFSKGKIID